MQTSSHSTTVTSTPTEGQTIKAVPMRRMMSLKGRKMKSKRRKRNHRTWKTRRAKEGQKEHIPEFTTEDIQICLKRGKAETKKGSVVDERYLQRNHQTREHGLGILEKVMTKVFFKSGDASLPENYRPMCPLSRQFLKYYRRFCTTDSTAISTDISHLTKEASDAHSRPQTT